MSPSGESGGRGVRRGVALCGHWLSLASVCRLAAQAEARGFEVLFVDGDTGEVPARDDAPLYDPAVLQAAALAATARLQVGAIRLPEFYGSAALIARSLATLQAHSGGRALAFFGVGAGRHGSALGLRALGPAERIAALAETLEVLRPLLSGVRVTREGEHVRLRGARSTPCVPVPPLIVAAARPRALALVARHADVWDANLPPLRELLEPARAQLGRALPTWIWVFARPGASAPAAAAAYRRLCPWFGGLSAQQSERAVLGGDPLQWPARLGELAAELAVDLVVLDLIGLDEAAAARAIAAFPQALPPQMS
jgi:alkanesulfonate monooxygenase SsuD/methylene tetrahydromethanopterin reductase-like flavin-dependent oxidoreductase (luciferase family)